jgi:kelch-like protein 2/3
MKQILSSLNVDNVHILFGDLYPPPWKVPNFTFLNPFNNFDKASTADIIFKQVYYHHRQCYCNYTPIFTDGSKSDNFVGCAYVIKNKIRSFSLHPAFSIFSAEILAIFKALEELMNYDKGNFIIYTDSLSVLQSLLSHHHNHPLISKVFTVLENLTHLGFSIKFCWIPSHVGIQGNELVDRAAKTAVDYLPFDLPYYDMKNLLTATVYSEWQQSWSKQLGNKLYAVKSQITVWPSITSRKHDVIITRLRIGHTRFTHRHLLIGESTPTCSHCKTAMTVKHILIECPNFTNQRCHYFQSHNLSLKYLLNITPHKNIFIFLKSIGFYPYI